ncbi:MAG TPA: hypothetical protein VIM16_19280 [Mucilaginibacter sp.]|jgi:hypothetical protein
MDNFPFDTTGLCSEDMYRLNETYKALSAKFHIELTGQINFHLNQFEVFKNYLDINLRDSYVIKHPNKDSYILFIETHMRNVSAKATVITDYFEYHTWALAYLKHDFGRVLIRRETLTDKLIELIHPVELDFEEDKAFSDTFYVLVNERDKAASAIDRNFRNAVMDIRHDNFVIEIVEHTLIIGSQEPISPERAVYLAEFVSRVASMC